MFDPLRDKNTSTFKSTSAKNVLEKLEKTYWETSHFPEWTSPRYLNKLSRNFSIQSLLTRLVVILNLGPES